jgi:hypothetical protein
MPATRVPDSVIPSLTVPRQMRASDSLPLCGA